MTSRLKARTALSSAALACGLALAACEGPGAGPEWWTALVCPRAIYPAQDDPPPFPGAIWSRIEDPSRLGWDEAALREAGRKAGRIGLAAVFVVDGGRLVWSWGCAKQEWYVASLRKSFMNAVIGQHVAAGRLTPETTLATLGLDDDPPLSPAERQTTLRQLLTSSSGICRMAAAGSTCTPREAESRQTPFIYNNWDFNMLLAVHRAVSPIDFFEYFQETIARPVGMEGFDAAEDGRYVSAAGLPHPAYAMDMSAQDMARFGLLYLRGGRWNGSEILAPDWIEESTRSQVHTQNHPGAPGYGFLWWVHSGAELDGSLPAVRFYSAEGQWSQAIFVFPERDTVIVVRGSIPRQVLFGTTRADEASALLAAILAADRMP